MVKRTVYLDNAAATPMDKKVKLAMEQYFSEKFYNPSATYLAAKAVAKDKELARSKVANWLGCKPSEIIFTAGGTEANNLAIRGVMDLHPGANLVVSAIEHESVLKPAEGYAYKVAPVSKDGLIDLEKLRALIDDKTVLVSLMYANNEIGTIEPIIQLSKAITEIKKKRVLAKNSLPLYLHTDACQTPSYLDLHVSRLGIDLMTLNGGKIYGPKQSGALYVNRHIRLNPQVLGGGQEMGMRSGTENVANIIGFAEAIDLVQSSKAEESKRMHKLQNYLSREIVNKIPGVKINGSLKKRLPNNLNITIPGQDNELMLMKLDELGILCASGSACNANSGDASLTLLAISLSEKEAQQSLRFSMGKSTTKNDLDYLLKSLVKIL